MKRLLSILMGLLLVLSFTAYFTGCDLFGGGDDDESEATPTPAATAASRFAGTPC